MIAARRAKALAIRAASGAKRCMRDSPLNGLSTRQHPSQFEAANARVAQNVGPKAIDMLSLDRPDIDWVPLARAMGVEGFRATTIAELNLALERGLASRAGADRRGAEI